MPSRLGSPNKKPSKYAGMSVAEYFKQAKQRTKQDTRTMKKLTEAFE
jgi:hypothetical protein